MLKVLKVACNAVVELLLHIMYMYLAFIVLYVLYVLFVFQVVQSVCIWFLCQRLTGVLPIQTS